jgi:hypothetical protein
MKMQFIVLLLMVLNALHGAEKPGAGTTVVRYGEKDLIPVHTKLRFTTLIMLSPGDEIAEVSCGDKEFWVIDGRDNIVHVKPTRAGAVTNVNVVLRNKSVYSFLVDEVGDKGTPDLKVAVGPDEAERLRADKLLLEQQLKDEILSHKGEISTLQGLRDLDKTTFEQALQEAVTTTPARLSAFLAKQKLNYVCYSKTEICVAAVIATDTNTYVIGSFTDLPAFTGYDRSGHYLGGIPFERKGNLFVLESPVGEMTLWYRGKPASFSAQ